MSPLTDEAKTIYDLANQGAIIELHEPLLRLQEQVFELRAANSKLRKENRELKERIDLQEKVKFSNKVYLCYSDEAPFCPSCFKRQGMSIFLAGPVSKDNKQIYSCPECKKEYMMS